MLYVVEGARGVTQLGDVVYAVGRGSSFIKTFSVDTLSPVGEGMGTPMDIVVCDRHLYVADNQCIWRVSADDHSYVKWLSTTGRLSVTSRGLLVTSPSSLREYSTTDKQLLRHMMLPRYVTYLYHGVERSHWAFVISHQGTAFSQHHDAVSELFSCRHISDRVLSRHFLLEFSPMCPEVR